MSHQILVVVLACALPLLARDYPDYPVKAARQYPTYRAKDGVAVALEAVTDELIQKKYLGLDFTSKHYLPVFVVMNNATAEDSVIVQPDEIRLVDKRGEQAGKKGTEIATGRSRAAETVAILSIPAAIVGANLPGMLISAKLMAISSEIRYNVSWKQLRAQTLAPGEVASGFLFVPIESIHGDSSLRVSTYLSGRETPVEVEVSLPALPSPMPVQK